MTQAIAPLLIANTKAMIRINLERYQMLKLTCSPVRLNRASCRYAGYHVDLTAKGQPAATVGYRCCAVRSHIFQQNLINQKVGSELAVRSVWQGSIEMQIAGQVQVNRLW